MPVKLPDVTVVSIDSVVHDLTKAALDDTLLQIAPADVMVLNDPSIDSLDSAMRILWYDVPKLVKTTHFLVVQWDGWVLDGSRWNDDWLAADYLGALWPWHHDGLAVGNGGFSLRSTDLARWVAANPARYPLVYPEDDTLCRRYRRAIERDGFVWGSLAQADAFSFERDSPRQTFGFHGAWNWRHVLGPDALAERVALANDYVRRKPEWAELMAR